MFTNEGYGLVRVLGPDITWLIGVTLVILIVAFVANKITSMNAGDYQHSEVTAAKRRVRRFAFLVWVAMLIGFAWHAATTAASFRIPRSDVNATDVYRQMDAAQQGSPR